MATSNGTQRVPETAKGEGEQCAKQKRREYMQAEEREREEGGEESREGVEGVTGQRY